MTEVESLMLTTCFGVAMGLIVSSWWFLIKNWITERKEKKKKQEEKNHESN